MWFDTLTTLRELEGRIISFIDQPELIKKILQRLGLWEESHAPPARDPEGAWVSGFALFISPNFTLREKKGVSPIIEISVALEIVLRHASRRTGCPR